MKTQLKQPEVKTAEAVISDKSKSNSKDKAASKIGAGIITAALAIGVTAYALWPSNSLNGKPQLDLVPQNDVVESVMRMPLTEFQKAAMLADIHSKGIKLTKFGVRVANGGNVNVDVSGFKRSLFAPAGVMVVFEVPVPPSGALLNISAPGKATVYFRNTKTAFVNADSMEIGR